MKIADISVKCKVESPSGVLLNIPSVRSVTVGVNYRSDGIIRPNEYTISGLILKNDEGFNLIQKYILELNASPIFIEISLRENYIKKGYVSLMSAYLSTNPHSLTAFKIMLKDSDLYQ
jgi:hypothetical protein